MATKTSYIEMDLQFLEEELESCKAYVKSINLVDLQDRRGPKEMPNGKVVDSVICTKEQQAKSKLEVLEKIAKMLPSIDEMREKQVKSNARKGFDDKGNILTNE